MYILVALPYIASALSVYNGAKQATSGNKGAVDAGNRAAGIADPFGERRSFFGDYLMQHFGDLTKFDPTQIQNDPAYQFQMQSGMDAVNRGSAAQGTLGSGNRLIDLQKLGQGLASNFTNQQFGRNQSILANLGNFSGANVNPATAGNLALQGYQNGQNNFNTGMGNVFGGLGSLGKLFTGSSGGGVGGGDGSGGDGIGSDFGMSDIRLKENIKPIGKTFGGLTTYTYNYKGDKEPRMGVMAQEVEWDHPELVATLPNGFKAVNYRGLAELQT